MLRSLAGPCALPRAHGAIAPRLPARACFARAPAARSSELTRTAAVPEGSRGKAREGAPARADDVIRQPARPTRGNDAGGSILGRAVNDELLKAKSFDELVMAYRNNEDNIDNIALCTTWTRLAKHGVGAGRKAPIDPRALAFARKPLLSRTIARVPELSIRQVSNVLWGMGKLRMRLADEEHGHLLADEIEGRLRELIDLEGGFGANVTHGPQLWQGMGLCQYPWSEGLLRRMAAVTVVEMGSWSIQGLAQAASSLVKLSKRVALTPEQKGALAERITEVMSSEATSAELMAHLGAFSVASRDLQLPLPSSAVATMAQLLLEMPPAMARDRGPSSLIGVMSVCLEFGYRLTAREAQQCSELVDLIDGRWSSDDYVQLMWVVSKCPAYTPPAEMRERLLQEVQMCTLPMRAGQLLACCKAWGITLPSDTAARLSRLATSGRAMQNTKGR